ncbi:hypothetical protein B0H11DRAFT_1899897 [Mycena galericulata]|nr:hypothetical protein B0H11DRAFT_1899897 [Mycena galericulata]
MVTKPSPWCGEWKRNMYCGRQEWLGLGPRKGEKKNGPPSRVAVVELGNIETVHEPKPIQAVGALCMDRVAVLWSDPTAHTLREVKERMPSRLGARTDQVACALFTEAF